MVVAKQFPTTNKETPQNGDDFYMVAFKARTKCPKVSLPYPLPELLSTGICFSTYEQFHHLAFYT